MCSKFSFFPSLSSLEFFSLTVMTLQSFGVTWRNQKKHIPNINTENVSANVMYLLRQHVVLSFGRGGGRAENQRPSEG